VAGDQRGGTLGYPTANIAMDPQLVSPRYGIYAGEALGHRAAVSIGTIVDECRRADSPPRSAAHQLPVPHIRALPFPLAAVA
jgi:hypothetical protein